MYFLHLLFNLSLFNPPFYISSSKNTSDFQHRDEKQNEGSYNDGWCSVLEVDLSQYFSSCNWNIGFSLEHGRYSSFILCFLLWAEMEVVLRFSWAQYLSLYLLRVNVLPFIITSGREKIEPTSLHQPPQCSQGIIVAVERHGEKQCLTFFIAPFIRSAKPCFTK